MKFGRQMEVSSAALLELCPALQTLPFLPYKTLKHLLKQGEDKAFAELLEEFLGLSELAFRRHTSSSLRVRSPCLTERTCARMMGIQRSQTIPPDALNEWAVLNSVALRKIAKKCHKKGSCNGEVLARHTPSYMVSRLRVELQAHLLYSKCASQPQAADTSGCVSGESRVHATVNERISDGLPIVPEECVICFGPLPTPTAPDCGHAICSNCANSMLVHSKSSSCPVCRSAPMIKTKRMPHLRALLRKQKTTACGA